MNVSIEENAEVVSDEQLNNYLESVGAETEKAEELVNINSEARARAFAASVLFMAIISAFGFLVSFKLPAKNSH